MIQGSAPTVSVDNTAGCQLYLSKDSLGASITTAKSSEINVLVPGVDPNGDWVCRLFSKCLVKYICTMSFWFYNRTRRNILGRFDNPSSLLTLKTKIANFKESKRNHEPPNPFYGWYKFSA